MAVKKCARIVTPCKTRKNQALAAASASATQEVSRSPLHTGCGISTSANPESVRGCVLKV